MPVGTHGAVKAVSPSELQSVGSQIILSNTYHMYLRPGGETVAKLGDLHGFMQWPGPILTDSGGFQVFSLGEKSISGKEREPLRKVSEEGITFSSHLDGSTHLFSPEKSIQVQHALGADIIMAFDQPVYGMSDHASTEDAMQRTMRWLSRSINEWKTGDTTQQALFGIVQGGLHTDLHKESAEFTVAQDLPGNAIGGLAIGGDKNDMWEAVTSINSILPTSKPRYFMGLGDPPLDIVEATARGVDMYDCVSPSRLARHGIAWTFEGEPEVLAAFWSGQTEAFLTLNKPLTFKRLNLLNEQFALDPKPLVETDYQFPADLKGFSKGTLRHYLKENEMLGYRILTLHNIAFLNLLNQHMRAAIYQKEYARFMRLAVY